MAKTLSSIAGRQGKATEKLEEEVKWFLTSFMASDIKLALHSDGFHLSEADSKSRAAEHFYLTNSDG